jgi:tetratricopeptide (TPR) repeat protein
LKTSSIPSVAALNGAIESYTKAIEMKILVDKPDYMVHYKRACAYEKMEEMDKAADDFRVFLLADDRELSVSYSIGGVGQALSAFSRGIQQATARIRLTEQTLKKVFSAYDFDVSYSKKKLYSWGDKFKEARKMLKENPQEAAYRMGVILLLQENYKDAIQRLDEAVQIKPEDARSHFFRGIAHALQSRKGGLFGPSRSARELSETKAISDFERAIALTQDHALIEQANKWKKNVTSK